MGQSADKQSSKEDKQRGQQMSLKISETSKQVFEFLLLLSGKKTILNLYNEKLKRILTESVFNFLTMIMIIKYLEQVQKYL